MKLDIVFDQIDCVYHAGDVITGKINLFLETSVKTKSVSLNFLVIYL